MQFSEHEMTVAVDAAAKTQFAQVVRQAHREATDAEIAEGWRNISPSGRFRYREAALVIVTAAMAAIPERPENDVLTVPDTLEGLT